MFPFALDSVSFTLKEGNGDFQAVADILKAESTFEIGVKSHKANLSPIQNDKSEKQQSACEPEIRTL